mmetsp:Transcript_14429/g.29392  ORF Transcript_14429/g.29392 Transcript_14429/m.29392 type:complete len:733 (-) Transcript_14429:107-2305(-)
MPRNQGTSRKGKPKKEMRAAGFGRALERSTQKRFIPKANGSSAHGQGMMSTGARSIGIEEEVPESSKMKSVLEMDDLSDFLTQAQMANKDFQSEREQFLNIDSVGHEYVPERQPTVKFHDEQTALASKHASREKFAFHELSVPRRPKWTPGVTTPEELDAMENETFLEWRRGVAQKEEEITALAFATTGGGLGGASVTPYEKNLHVWRQLWRVLERSSVVLQIVDARNPLFYLSEDLRTYAMDELGKPMLMVVNKSDYLTERQRKVWSEYFTNKGIDHLFFSAYDEQKKIDKAAAAAKRGDLLDDKEERQFVSDDESDTEEGPNHSNGLPGDEKHTEIEEESSNKPTSEKLIGITHPLTREELLNALAIFATNHGCQPEKKYDNRIQYGMVGFPNVGKSSVINVLIGSSKNIHGVARVGVAAQPGKTKHFQTLLLPDRDDMMLCDCPGLVFPSFVSSTADMIAAGVYPIAQMRDHWPVVSLICKRIPREVLNAHYGIHIPEPSLHELREKGLDGKELPPPTAEELLGTYCIARSMLAPSSGVPDYQRASRVVVKDYSEGKLLYCHSPPPSDGGTLVIQDDEYQRETLKTAIRNTNNAKKLQKLLILEDSSAPSKSEEVKEVDDDNFDDFDDILGGMDDEGANSGPSEKRGKAHKSIKKWGKKGRKLRNKDPYGCQSDPDTVLNAASNGGSGVIMNAGKYSSSGYTRANYAGAKAATLFEGRANNNRPVKAKR